MVLCFLRRIRLRTNKLTGELLMSNSVSILLLMAKRVIFLAWHIAKERTFLVELDLNEGRGAPKRECVAFHHPVLFVSFYQASLIIRNVQIFQFYAADRPSFSGPSRTPNQETVKKHMIYFRVPFFPNA